MKLTFVVLHGNSLNFFFINEKLLNNELCSDEAMKMISTDIWVGCRPSSTGHDNSMTLTQ